MTITNRIGLIGIVVGILGICVAIFQDDLRAQFAPETQKVERSVIEKGIRIFSSDPVTESRRDRIDFFYIGLGLLALILGVVSFVKEENHRISALAGALGVMAIAWQYVLIGVVIAAAVFLIGSFS